MVEGVTAAGSLTKSTETPRASARETTSTPANALCASAPLWETTSTPPNSLCASAPLWETTSTPPNSLRTSKPAPGAVLSPATLAGTCERGIVSITSRKDVTSRRLCATTEMISLFSTGSLTVKACLTARGSSIAVCSLTAQSFPWTEGFTAAGSLTKSTETPRASACDATSTPLQSLSAFAPLRETTSTPPKTLCASAPMASSNLLTASAEGCWRSISPIEV